MKKNMSFMLAVVMLSVFVTPVFAAAPETVQPLYSNVAEVAAGLRIEESTGTAYCTGRVEGIYEIPVEVLVQLQVYKNGSWQTLISWSNTGLGYASVSQSFTIERGYQYRTFVTGYACNDLWLPIETATTYKEVYYPSN